MSAHTSKMPNKKATKISSADNLLKTSKLVRKATSNWTRSSSVM